MKKVLQSEETLKAFYARIEEINKAQKLFSDLDYKVKDISRHTYSYAGSVFRWVNDIVTEEIFAQEKEKALQKAQKERDLAMMALAKIINFNV